ncbi:GTPase-activating protein [Microbotryomycetes sp. JL221]|nr:GTPase-activating protein [Microbotryomycetes sp. JL221]
MDGMTAVSDTSISSFRPTKRPRRAPTSIKDAAVDGTAGAADAWLEVMARAMAGNTITPVAWSGTNLIAMPSPVRSNLSSVSAQGDHGSNLAPSITVSYLNGSTSPIATSRLSFELPVPIPTPRSPELDTGSSGAIKLSNDAHVSLLSFSNDSRYLLAVCSSDQVDVVTVWEQASSSCINEWTIVWSERVDRFGNNLNASAPTVNTVNDAGANEALGGDQVKRAIRVRWLGESKSYTVSSDPAQRKPLTAVPIRSPPVNGAAFVMVMSSSELLFVHLPRNVPLVPFTAVVPLTLATAQTEFSVTALPTPSTYSANAGLSANLGASPNNAMDALVANLVEGLPASAPTPNTLAATIAGVSNGQHLSAGSDALKEQLKLAEALGTAGEGTRVSKAAIGAVRMRCGIEAGETTFIVATNSRLIQAPPANFEDSSVLFSAARAASAQNQKSKGMDFTTAASSPDDFNNDFTDFSALDEAFGSTAKNSPANEGGEDQTSRDEMDGFERVFSNDELTRMINMTEVKLEMMAPDGPRVTMKQLPPVHLCDALDQHGEANLEDLTSLNLIEHAYQSGAQNAGSDTSDSGEDRYRSNIVLWRLSNEPLRLSSAFSKLDCKKSDVSVGEAEWAAHRVASTETDGLLMLLGPRPAPRANGLLSCRVMRDSNGKIINIIQALSLTDLQPLAEYEEVRTVGCAAQAAIVSPNGSLALLLPATGFAAPVLAKIPCPVTNTTDLLGLCVAASLASQRDLSDLAGRVIALRDNGQIISVIQKSQQTLQSMLPENRRLENSSLALELVGFQFAVLSVENPSTAKLSPRVVLVLCPTIRKLLVKAAEYVLAFKAFLSSFPLHQNAVVDTAKTILDDAIDFGGLNLVEWKAALGQIDVQQASSSVGSQTLLFSLVSPEQDEATTKTFLDTVLTPSNLFVPSALPTPPATPFDSSALTSERDDTNKVDILRRSRLPTTGDVKKCLQCGSKTEKRMLSGTETGRWTAYELDWEAKCSCGGQWIWDMAPLSVLMRDTFAGQLVYLLSGRKVFTHQEEDESFQVPDKYLETSEKRHKPSNRLQNGNSKQAQQSSASNDDDAERGGAQREPQRRQSDASSSDATAVQSRDSEQSDQDENIVDWYGPDDKENPLNWSVARKCFVTGCMCLMTTSVYSGSSVVTPGLMEIMQQFGVGQVVATTGSLSLFVFGYAVGPLILSPITEIPAVGRTAPYIITLAIYVALQVPAALTTSPAAFFIVRFLQGFFGSPPLATGGASISDMFRPHTRPFALGAWGLSAAAGPALGPVMSSFAIQYEGWHWHAWIMLWLAGFSLIFLIFTLPETSAINILVRRAQRLRRRTGNKELRSQGEIEQNNMTGKDILTMSLLRPLTLTFTEPIVIALNGYISFVYITLYSFFESFPLVFEMGYGWQLGISTLPYLSLLVGSFIGYAGFCIWNRVYFMPRFLAAEREGRKLPPEHRLPPAMIGGFCYPICLFWFGWSANRTLWVAPVISTSFFGIGTTLMFMGVLSYLPDAYPKYVASTLASNDFQRSMLGGASPIFAGIMFKKLGIDWGSSLLGFVSVALIPIPWVLFKYGHKIRAKSKLAETFD